MNSYQRRKTEVAKLRAELEEERAWRKQLHEILDSQNRRHRQATRFAKEAYMLLLAHGIDATSCGDISLIEAELISDRESISEITRRTSRSEPA